MRYALLLALVAAIPPQAPDVEEPPSQAPAMEEPVLVAQAPAMTDARWLSPEPMPTGSEWFKGDGYTQAIYSSSSEGKRWHHLDPVKVDQLDPVWRVSGGMLGLTGWRSDKFRFIPPGEQVRSWVGLISVWNGGGFQQNKGLRRSYPIGTRFDDILSDAYGRVFEHRTRSKEDNGKWRSEVIYEDKTARPFGYSGLSVSCASCHSEAGRGNYGQGLIPGSDTVLSDPLPWDSWKD